MSCRICLSEEVSETFVSPCRCVGTSAFVHAECLDTYFAYYPDRICRVCLTQMEAQTESMLAYLMLGVLGLSITYSAVGPLIKLGLTASLFGLTVYYSKRKFFNDTVVAFLLALYMTFATGGHPDAVFLFFLALYCVSLVATICVTKQIGLFLLLAPPLFALAIHIVLALDSFATAVYVSLLFLVWYAWLRSTVRNGILPT